jgi:NADPH2:quinone reductase
MKAIRIHQFGGPEVLTLEEVPEPTPGPGQVLVGAAAIGVNPVEAYIRAGNYGPRAFAFTPGSDLAGVVQAIGEGVSRVSVGDRVYTSGTISGAYAERAVCSEASVHPLPERASFQQGAALGVPAATAYYALFYRGGARPGESVLVHGASGAVGTCAVQLARAAGLHVIGTASGEEGQRFVRQQGAHAASGHDLTDDPQRVAELTGGRGGFDLILEMLANVNLGKDLPCLARFGRVVVIGSRGPVEINPRDTMGRNADIRGMLLGNATPDESRGIHAALIAALDAGTLHPVIERELPLSAAAEAQRLVMDHTARGKIVLIP